MVPHLRHHPGGGDAELSRALSFYGVMMGLAASIGQFAGGALVEWSPFDLGWRTVFLAKLPIGVPVMLAAWLMVPETSTSRRQRLDIGGAVLVSLALGCLVLPLSEGREQDWPAWTFVCSPRCRSSPRPSCGSRAG